MTLSLTIIIFIQYNRFDPETNTWSDVPSLKMAVTSPAVVAHDGALYVTKGDEVMKKFDNKTGN